MDTELITKVSIYCKDLLNKSRCKSLQFHNYQHTLNVVQNAKTIALKSGVCEDELEILLISAYFHDVGNMEANKKHELLSCSIARRFLEKENFPEEKIITIENIILATEINREPKTLLEKIICDADLGHLGTTSFLNQNKLLREEWASFLGMTFTNEEWLQLNLKFLDTHQFYTEVARTLYLKQKSENIQRFKDAI